MHLTIAFDHQPSWLSDSYLAYVMLCSIRPKYYHHYQYYNTVEGRNHKRCKVESGQVGKCSVFSVGTGLETLLAANCLWTNFRTLHVDSAFASPIPSYVMTFHYLLL